MGCSRARTSISASSCAGVEILIVQGMLTSDTVRERGEDAAMMLRLARDLVPFLRTPTTLDQGRRRLRSQLANREQRFLDAADATIFRHRRSPYRQLLAHAGCERGDLQS